MKKTIFALLLIASISTFASAQSKSSDVIVGQIKSLNAGKNISIEYDKASNYSKLILLSDGFGNDQNKRNGLSSFTFGMMHGFNGNVLTNQPDVFILTFWAKGKNTRFAESHTWKAVVDGESLEVGEGRFAKKKGDDREFLNFGITREVLTKISNGKNVSFQIGQSQFNVSPEMLKLFYNYLKIAAP